MATVYQAGGRGDTPQSREAFPAFADGIGACFSGIPAIAQRGMNMPRTPAERPENRPLALVGRQKSWKKAPEL
jgi:hypothetical protein